MGDGMITYRTGNDIDVGQMIALYVSSTIRRPTDDVARMGEMLAGANLVVSAWDGELLVGMSRALSDFAYVTYLSDLAVRATHQKQGIGRELIRRTQAAAPRAKIVLLAAPSAREYYPGIGMKQHPSAWLLEVDQRI